MPRSSATQIATTVGIVISALGLLAAVYALISSQEARRELLRPIVKVEEEASHPKLTPERLVNLESKVQPVMLTNVGAGLAARITGVIFWPNSDDQTLSDRRLWLDLSKVLAPGAQYEDRFAAGRTLVRGSRELVERRTPTRWDCRRYTLWVPRNLTGAEPLRAGRPQIIRRLTLTYHDVYGRKHASIYDYLELLAWQSVAFLKDIDYDLDELDRMDAEGRKPPVVGQVSSQRKLWPRRSE